MENSLLNKVLFCNYSEIILWTFGAKCIRSISYEVLINIMTYFIVILQILYTMAFI